MAIAKKYEFNTKSTAHKYINELWVEDKSGNKVRKEPYYAHVVVIGFIPTEFDEDGVATAFSDKYSVDVLWESEIEARWNTYEIEIEGEGVHKFL